MKLSKFSGGVHPPDNKITSGSPVKAAPIPKRVVLPLSQHIGAPNESLVAKGDEVKIGQKIAESGAFVSAPVFASISGKVVDIAPYPHPMGSKLPAIVIEAGEQEDDKLVLEETPDPFTLPEAELKDRVKQAGIVGLGGATFPTHVKLSPPKEKPIDTVVINGAECEPYLTADHRLMLEKPEQVVNGAKIVMKILGAKQVLIGIENNKPDAVEALNKVSAQDSSVTVIALKVKYPQGSEKHLIKSLLDREVPPPPGLPMDVGVVVQNVGTAVAIWEAAKYNEPLIERVVTVTGKGINTPKNLLVRLGTPINELIEFCGGLKEDVGKVILGGPMMGFAQFDLSVPVIKGTSGILVQLADEVPSAEYQTCIRCGKCVVDCPCILMPNLFGIYGEKGMFDEVEANHVMYCLECGCCSYNCPANRPLIQWIRQAKAAIRAQAQTAKK